MAKSELVVALDIGTTKVCTLVAEVSGEDQIDLLGVGMAPSTGMRKGVVVDIAATAAAIRDSVEMAERTAGVHIATVYVGITGEHIQSFNSRGGVDVADEVTDEHVQQARIAARRVLPEDREVLHTIPRQYIVDGQEGVRHPTGMSARRLEVETHVVTAATSFVENVLKCARRARVQIEEIVVEPYATGLAVLTDAERQLGVVLADIGGGTTDVALWVDGVITHTTVIPVGGMHVTNDLAIAFRLTPSQAERMKVHHASASVTSVDTREYIELQMIGEQEPRELPRRLFAEIVEPRMTELFSVLAEHLRRAASEGVHVSSCVLSGGGSQLAGVTELASHVLELPVRVGCPRDVIDPRGQVASPVYATGVGLLSFAARKLAGRRRAREPRSLAAAAVTLVVGWLRHLGFPPPAGRSGPLARARRTTDRNPAGKKSGQPALDQPKM